MDVLTITFVTACSALVSAAAGPLVSVVVASRQIRASLVSNNRERWNDALRDSVAEYASLALSAAILQEALRMDPVDAIRGNPDLARLVERLVLAKGRMLLMVNPEKDDHQRLCVAVEEAYRLLLEGRGSVEAMGGCVEAITNAGRDVLRTEWARVKRGE